MTQWSIGVEVQQAGWYATPKHASEQERAEWAMEVAAQLKQVWGDAWQEDLEGAIPMVAMAAAQERDPGAILHFVVFPAVGYPVASRVTIGVVDSVDLGELTAPEGTEVLPVESNVGPGVQVWRRRISVDPPLAVVESTFLFRQADGVTLVVAPAPVAADVYALVAVGLSQMFETITVETTEGRVFRPVPIEPYSVQPEYWGEDLLAEIDQPEGTANDE